MITQASRQRGFTLIELVAVLVILGLLAAVAIPRFSDISDSTHTPLAQMAANSFRTGSTLIRTQWISSGNTGGIQVSATGWPDGAGGGAMSAGTCLTAFNDLIQTSAPVNTGIAWNTPGWGTWGSGNWCVFAYQPDTSPFRYFIYNVSSGLLNYLEI